MNSSAVSFFWRTILKNVVTSLLATSSSLDMGLVGWIRLGEMGSILILLGTLTEERLIGAFSLNYLLSLLKEPPLEVLLADPILTSMGEISY
jgi:hypothetical protein